MGFLEANTGVTALERAPSHYPVNIRVSFPFFTKPFFFTLIIGREKRGLTRRQQERARHPLNTWGNLAVFVAVLHTNRVVGRNGAVELGGTCLLFWHVLTINDSLGCKAVAVLRSHSDVPGCHISGHPDL